MIELGLEVPAVAVERREAETDSYTETVTAQRLAAANAIIDATSLGVIEACAGLWARAFAAADSDKLSSSVLARIGRSLLLNGECVYLIDGLVEASTWDVTGGMDAATWRYRLDLPGPSSSTTATRPYASVLHFRIGQTKEQPWKGVSLFERAGLTRDLLACIETSLRHEFNGPVGHVLPVPAGSTQTDLASDVAALKGQVALGETTSAGHGEGRASAPQKDWQAVRIGPNPPQTSHPAARKHRADLAGRGGRPAGPGWRIVR